MYWNMQWTNCFALQFKTGHNFQTPEKEYTSLVFYKSVTSFGDLKTAVSIVSKELSDIFLFPDNLFRL